jgi:anti-sigma factor RsiW
MIDHPQESLSAYADGELAPPEAALMEAHLAQCTECMRDLARIRAMGGAMQAMREGRPERSLWEGVHARLTKPVGWILMLTGFAMWLGLALLAWFRNAFTLEWLALTALGLGLLMLAVGIGYEQYCEWKHSPYRSIER